MFAFYKDDIVKVLAIVGALMLLALLYAASFLYGDWE
jgi:hypothetical protein